MEAGGKQLMPVVCVPSTYCSPGEGRAAVAAHGKPSDIR